MDTKKSLLIGGVSISNGNRPGVLQLFALCIILSFASGCSMVSNRSMGSAPNSPLPFVSPLDEFRSVLVGTPWHNELLPDDERTRLFDATVIRREELIAQCMLGAGFSYWPQPQNHTLELPAEGEWLPDDEDWVTLNGFGIFATGLTPPRGLVTQWFVNDANMEFVRTLSEDGFIEYQRALQGRVFDIANGFESVSDEVWIEINANPTLENAGCQGWAAAEVMRENGEKAANDQFAPLFEALTNMQRNLENSVSDSDRDWARCMAVAGHPDFEKQADAAQSIWVQASEIQSNWDFEVDGSDPTRSPEMISLREYEIILALADLDCRISTDFNARQEQERIATETIFFNDHINEFQALRLAVELGELPDGSSP